MRRMVEGLCILSDLTCQASEESGEKDQEESWIFGQQIRSTDDCVILCLAVKRHLAWTTYELYLLWHVLFYAHCDREFRIFQFLKLFVIVNIGEMFFRADTVATGFRMLRGIVTDFHITALAETNFGVDVPDLILASVSILLVFVVDVIHEKGISIRRKVAECKLPVRWSFWYAVILLVVVFGAYGSGYTIVDMIYAAY